MRPRLTLKETATHALLLLLLLAALFPATFLRGETALPAALLFDGPPWRDHMPADLRPFNNPPSIEAFILFNMYFSVAKQSLAAGEWPLWNPFEFAGIPLLANYQSATVYPLRILHALLPVPIATTIFILLKLWCCGMTTYVCARVMLLRRAAATFASIGWMLSGYHLAWAYHAIPDISAWLPLLLLGAEFFVMGRHRRGFFTMTIAATLLLLAGHPESAFTGALGVGAYFFIRLFQRRAAVSARRAILLASASWAIALSVASIQILPFLEYLPRSHTYVHRAGDSGAQHFLEAAAFPIFWVPRFFGAQPDGAFWADGINVSSFTMMTYGGIPVFLAISLLLCRFANRIAKQRSVAFAVPTCVFLLMAFRAPVIEPVFKLPPFNSTWGSWHLIFPMMAFCFLGAIGLDHWLSRPRRFRELWPTFLVVVLVCAAIAFRFQLDRQLLILQNHETYVLTQLGIAAFVCAASLVLIAVHTLSRGQRIVAPALCMLLALDLLWAARGLAGASPASHVLFPTPLTRHLQQLAPATRINAASAGIMAGLLQPFGIDELHAYDGILPARMWSFLGGISGETRSRLEPLTGVSYYLHDPALKPTFDLADSNRFTFDTTIDGVAIYKDNHAFPRAFLVNHTETCETPDELFARLRDPSFEPRRTALLETEFSASITDADEETGDASIVARSFNAMKVKVESQGNALLVVTDAYYPGWTASIDGRSTDIIPAYHAFRGVAVPPGQHTVEFQYRPKSFQFGLAISCVVLVFGNLFALYTLRARKTRA
ncbi:MAG: YfhO family protein [Candidatus Hydrogenedentes bacterium]|nr:YfhO family protein [Candidatus Hydrogenedentota bacterium]